MSLEDRGGPIIMHGARVYARQSHGPCGVKHTASVKPLDRRRMRPIGWWMLDLETGLQHGFVESLRGHVINADGLELEELVQRTVEAVR